MELRWNAEVSEAGLRAVSGAVGSECQHGYVHLSLEH